MDFDYTITFGTELDFANPEHLENHIKYLCRTDTAQKWTNELTAYNVAVIWENEKEFTLFGHIFDTRKRIAEQIREICRKNHVYDNDVVFRNLRMLRGEYVNDRIFRFNTKMLTDMKDILFEISQIKGVTVLCAVTHIDQKNNFVHFHVLLINENSENAIEMLEKNL